MPVVKIFSHIRQRDDTENKFEKSLAAELWSATFEQFTILRAEGSHISLRL